MTASCSNCRHSFMTKDKQGNPHALICRRYPPTVLIMMVPGAQLATPQNPQGVAQVPCGNPVPIAADWLCGEWANVVPQTYKDLP